MRGSHGKFKFSRSGYSLVSMDDCLCSSNNVHVPVGLEFIDGLRFDLIMRTLMAVSGRHRGQTAVHFF
jgi:hypothetical protein